MALQDISISWEGHDGTDVEAYIRSYLSQIAGKIGYARVSDEKFPSLDGNEYYHLLCYASKDDYDNGEEPLYESEIPISTDRGTSYTARLYASVPTTTPIIAVEKRKLVYLKFHAIQNDNGQVDDYGAPGTLQFQRSVGLSGAWENVGSGTIQSQPQSGTTYSEFDIGQYFSETNPQQIRARASYVIDDPDTGESKTISSPWLTWSNITYTRLNIQSDITFIAALDAATANNQFPLRYKLTGEVDRVLHIKISGGTSLYETTINLSSSQYTNFLNPWSGNITDSQTFGLLTHGVRTIEAWLTCSDGSGGTISSEHVINQVMVDAGDDDDPRLLVENLVTNVQNYVPVNPLFTWAVWTRNSEESVSVEFLVTDYEGEDLYLNEIYTAQMGNSYDQLSTIEIEGSEDDTLYAYFKAFINETLVYGPITINVDNSNKFSPTVGANWVLNPKVKNNSSKVGDDALDNVEDIDGATAHFSGFSWVNDINAVQPDGWVVDENRQRVLRIPAGRSVTIDYDWLDSFSNNKKSNVTLELDFKVRNISREDLPIIQMLTAHGNEYIGLKMLPLEGVIFTATNKVASSQDFRWQEDERIHIAINIVSELLAIDDVNANPLPLCRVFINGIINREFIFDTVDNDWKRNGLSPCNIIIGQIAADIDIYGIRIYKNNALNNSNILDDYVATIPDGNQKLSFRESNKILGNNGTVSYDRCKEKGVNVLVWRGQQPTHNAPASTYGWWEIHIYNDNGVEDLAHSGTICQSSKSLEASRQGTTANTYFYSNIQTKLKDVSKAYEKELVAAYVACGLGTKEEAEALKAKQIAKILPYNSTGTGSCGTGIWVEVSKIHSDYSDFNESDERPGYAFVCDGWVDGNGMYRGPQYQSIDGIPYATKLVGKINYASSMQSHLMGACRLYNDLHYRIVGPNSLQAGASGAIPRVAKYEELFMYFTNPDENLQPEFQGPITWGAGKMDDPTWGYNKNNMFCMIEGADNNKTLTDMRIPWQSDRIYVGDYDKGKGKTVDEVVGWTYNGVLSLNLDRCKASVRDFLVNNTSDPNEAHTRQIEGPSDAVIGRIKDFVNFIYLHNVRIRFYNGTYDQFRASNEWSSWRDWQVWCNSGSYQYRLLRYDEVDDNWVDAGWDVENEQVEALYINQKYSAAVSANSGNWNNINSAVIAAIAEDARQNIDSIINARSLLFHYAFTIQFLAGTDNCSKNTYYTLYPDANDPNDPDSAIWYFCQDDMDTILATDNSGFQNKPYYIDRQNPYAENSNDILYEGGANALFNLCEAMYGGNEIRTMMAEVFTNMCELVSQNDALPYVDNNAKRTVWGAMWKFFFSTQKRIPAVAYNETARIRYEYPESLGFTSDGRNVPPISQSMGDQLQAELQFMKRRIVMLASYAEWGDFSTDTAHRTGISSAIDNLSFNVYRQVPLPNQDIGDMFIFELKNFIPHQYIWPSGSIGNTIHSLRSRCIPGVQYNFVIGQVEGDTTGTFYGSNYYRSFGNIGDISVKPTAVTTITAKRLVDVTAVPSNNAKPNFRPSQLNLSTPLLEVFDLHNSSLIKGSLDLSECTRLQTINISGCNDIYEIRFPHTSALTSLSLGSGLGELIIDGQPNMNIDNISTQGLLDNITNVVIKGNSVINTQAVFSRVIGNVNTIINGYPQLNSLTFENVQWTISAAQLEMLLKVPTVNITGNILVTGSVGFSTAMLVLQRFSRNGDLTITYQTIVGLGECLVGGKKRLDVNEAWNGTYIASPGQYQFDIEPNRTDANNITNIAWSVDLGNASGTATIDSNGILSVPEGGLNASGDTSKITIQCVITTTNNTFTRTFDVGLYARESAKIADYVFADGTFSDVYNPVKTVVGICIYVSSTRQIRVMVGTTTFSGYCWGLYNNSNGGITGIGNVTVEGKTYYPYDIVDVPNNSYGSNWSGQSGGFSEVNWNGEWMTYGERNTLAIIKSRDIFLAQANLPAVSSEGFANELSALKELIRIAGSPNNQYYFPMASYCHAYVPTVKSDEVCVFGEHHWFLPNRSELCRYGYYYKNRNSEDVSANKLKNVFLQKKANGSYVITGNSQANFASSEEREATSINAVDTTRDWEYFYLKNSTGLYFRPYCRF